MDFEVTSEQCCFIHPLITWVAISNGNIGGEGSQSFFKSRRNHSSAKSYRERWRDTRCCARINRVRLPLPGVITLLRRLLEDFSIFDLLRQHKKIRGPIVLQFHATAELIWVIYLEPGVPFLWSDRPDGEAVFLGKDAEINFRAELIEAVAAKLFAGVTAR